MRFAVLLPVVVALSCGETPPRAPHAQLRVDPPAIAFGKLIAPATRTVTVRNLGDLGTTLQLEPPVLDSPDFSVATPDSLELLAGGPALELIITAAPTSPGFKTADLVFESRSGSARVTLTANALAPRPCTLQVRPPRLDFGVLSGVRELEVTVTSISEGYCTLSDVELEAGSDAVFSIPAGQLPLTLLPGQTKTLRVQAAPRRLVTPVTARVTGTLRLEARRVELAATLLASCLTLSPNDFDFGTVRRGCERPARTFAIYNTCPLPAELSAPRFLGSTDFRLRGTSLPVTLMPGGSPATFTVDYLPSDVGPDTGAVILTADSVDYVVTFRGAGDAFASNVDTFAIPAAQRVDLLLVLDNSPSMASHQTSVAQNVDRLADYLLRSGIDLQLAVTTSDGSGILLSTASNPAVLTDTTPDLRMLLGAKLSSAGTGGSETTQLLASASAAVALNPGFERDGGVLSVVTLSDSDDQSPLPVTSYFAPRRFISAVGPDRPFAPAGCSYDTGFGQPRMRQAVTAASGLAADICDSTWSQSFIPLGGPTPGVRSTFFLSADPVSESVAVTVNGAAASGWMYEPVINAVTFAPASIPPRGSTIQIRYDVTCF